MSTEFPPWVWIVIATTHCNEGGQQLWDGRRDALDLQATAELMPKPGVGRWGG